MLEEVAADICASPVFQTTVDRIEQAWLRRQLELDMAAGISTLEVKKLLEAAAILACSSKKQNRQLAYRIATLAFEHCGETELPSDQALRVVLTRLGNFPALNTKPAIESAATRLPLSLFVEEQHAVKSHTLSIGENTLVLTPFQFELWASLAEGSQVAFNAPTSSGKSFVLGQYVCSRFLSSGSLNVVFLVPTRALISQVADDVAQLLGDLKLDDVDVIWLPPSEEAELPSRSVYVFTQERLQLLLGTHTNFNPDLVVVDEAQSISDGSRGVLLQWAIDDILDAGQSTQVLFASPAVSNLEVFQNLFRLPNLRALTTAEPSVSQNFIVAKVTSTKNGEIELASLGDGSAERRFLGKKSLNQVLASKRDRLVHISHHFGAGSVNIVYANGAAEAEKVALQLADMQDESTLFHDSLKDLAELADESVHPKYALSYCIQKGVAFHYGNIPTKLRRAIEVAASSGLIRYLVCTSTLLQGVNLPAKNIFLCQPERGRETPLDSVDFWNLAGRAGRLGKEFLGNIFLIDYDKWKAKPLEKEKNSEIKPALAKSVVDNSKELLDLIDDSNGLGPPQDELEATFTRLLADYKQGNLDRTLEDIGIPPTGQKALILKQKLASASPRLTLPVPVLRATPSVSANRQQQLFNHLESVFLQKGEVIIPCHPRESDAYESYTKIVGLCYHHLRGIKGKLHTFHVVMALKWMKGQSRRQIIADQLLRHENQKSDTTIRKTLNTIEQQIRFEMVRCFGCYIEILKFMLTKNARSALIDRISPVHLYLEVGACDKTMMSFISLGLSRVTAAHLNDLCPRKNLDKKEALDWLRSRPTNTLGLTKLLEREVERISR